MKVEVNFIKNVFAKKVFVKIKNHKYYMINEAFVVF
tara:strand:+ start:457 stop:564 length:108 start_codon:yes stop_codon:yes gene_type:complete